MTTKLNITRNVDTQNPNRRFGIKGSTFKTSEQAWIQATLPIRNGGLGTRKISSVALPAFLSSIHSTLDLAGRILKAPAGINYEIACLNEATNDSLAGPNTTHSCWSTAGGICESNNCVSCGLQWTVSANMACPVPQPQIVRSDGKRPDGMSLIPWKTGRALVWDATCTDTLAASYLTATTNRAGAAVDARERLKRAFFAAPPSRSSRLHTSRFWKKKFAWRPRWVKTWQEKKVYVAVWKRMWGPLEVNEWVPLPKPPPGWIKHDVQLLRGQRSSPLEM
ncbi:hypothetical protein MSG28_001061 [Choristoneura fumiferana]|uniref:Uncharacterized protein n=1 Tax=Choristoneura fumiferana TaxID=7141 RepID=A0ACC0K3W3_CHOFU|nr:hypothetical protein MSG28_001061 [Choristoneura fumiferana]